MAPSKLNLSWADRFWVSVAPGYGQRRIEARARIDLLARHYDAAQPGRRTDGMRRTSTDANAANGPSLSVLRNLARNLRRNNVWARRGISVITNNTVGWGIRPKAIAGRSAGRARAATELWNAWAKSTACDFNGLLNLYGLQRLAMATIVESGEVLIIKQPPIRGVEMDIPLRLQVLEPDYLDGSRDGALKDGGKIVQGIEINRLGQRVAYWLYTTHPGSMSIFNSTKSERIPADRVQHVYDVERSEQMRGVSWLATVAVRVADVDDFEDAELLQQKIAACFGAFVSDLDGVASPLGELKTDKKGQPIEELQPGHIEYLPPGKTVSFATPPAPRDAQFSSRKLRGVAAGLNVTYEDLTGDYSQVNYSSARMGRNAHQQSVDAWQEHMFIPMFCQPVWGWAMDILQTLEGWPDKPDADWAVPPMPMLDPDKEAAAYLRAVRNGQMTWAQMIRSLGYDPTEQLDEIEAMNEEFDRRGIVLDIDPRRVSNGGQLQVAAAGNDEETPAATKKKPTEEDGAGKNAYRARRAGVVVTT